jgi:hypothetical protein
MLISQKILEIFLQQSYNVRMYMYKNLSRHYDRVTKFAYGSERAKELRQIRLRKWGFGTIMA